MNKDLVLITDLVTDEASGYFQAVWKNAKQKIDNNQLRNNFKALDPQNYAEDAIMYAINYYNTLIPEFAHYSVTAAIGALREIGSEDGPRMRMLKRYAKNMGLQF